MGWVIRRLSDENMINRLNFYKSEVIYTEYNIVHFPSEYDQDHLRI